MNKTELIAAAAERSGLTKKDTEKALNAALDAITAALVAGDKTAAQTAYTQAVKAVDQAVVKGLLHKNNAARKKSSMTLQLNKLA